MKKETTKKTIIGKIALIIAAFILLACMTQADTVVNGVWQINATQGIKMSNGSTVALFANTTSGKVGINATTLTEIFTISGNIGFSNGPKIIDNAGKLQLRAGGTGNGSGGNGSIYFLDSSGNTRGRFDTTAISTLVGSGSDGPITINSTKNLNTDIIGSYRSTYADGIAYRINAPTDSTNTLSRYSASVTLANGIAVGDELLLINLQGAAADVADVGKYEFVKVSAINSTTITLENAITKSYDGSSATNQKVIVQRVPHYTAVNIASAGSLTASSWDGLATTPTGAAGYLTGIVAFRANGAVTVQSGGSITTTGKGYRGGTGASTYTGTATGGESLNGTNGGGSAVGTNAGSTGGHGGGGGGGILGTTTSAGGAGSSTGGAGGAGGNTNENNPTSTLSYSSGSASGGGGHSTHGGGGRKISVGECNAAMNSGTNGSAGTSGSGSASVATTNFACGGHGGGGGTYGDSALTSTLTFGSASGGAGAVKVNHLSCDYAGPNGANGGGIIFIAATSVSVSGTVSSNGNAGTASASVCSNYAHSGSSGGGAGGSIKIATVIAALGSGLVTASGGTTTEVYATGGAGGAGYVRVEYIDSLSGTSTPSASTATTIASNAYAAGTNASYGILYVGSVNTLSADLAEYYTSGDKSIEAGDVVCFSNLEMLDDGREETVKRAVLRKCKKANDPDVVGIISTNPGLAIGSADSISEKRDQLALALAGRVPTKVSKENGNIKIGDRLTTSSTPGVAMKAKGNSYVIGRAMQDFDEDVEIGKVTVFIHLEQYIEEEFFVSKLWNKFTQKLTGASKDATETNAKNSKIKNELCINNTCVTEEQLKALLAQAESSS